MPARLKTFTFDVHLVATTDGEARYAVGYRDDVSIRANQAAAVCLKAMVSEGHTPRTVAVSVGAQHLVSEMVGQ